MKTLNEQIQRLRDILHTCYESIASKGGTLPPVGERNMTNLPDAVESVPQKIGAELEELTITQNGEYLPQEGVDGFSKVVAEFDTSSLPKVRLSSLRINNDCIDENGYWAGELIDTSECTNLTDSFSRITKLKQLNVSNWNISNITSLRGTFYACNNLEYLDVSNWDVSKVTDMYGIFDNCGVKSFDFSKWDISNVNNISYFGANKTLTFIGGRTIDEVLVDNIKCLNGLRRSFYVYSKALDRASLRALINGLADLTGQTVQTLTLGSTLMAKLTEEDIAIAVNKNWNLA
jgi:surface protein